MHLEQLRYFLSVARHRNFTEAAREFYMTQPAITHQISALERELSPSFFGLTLRDRTRPARAVWDRMGEDTLTGLFLREMARRCAQEPDSQICQLAVRFGLAALEGGEDAAL